MSMKYNEIESHIADELINFYKKDKINITVEDICKYSIKHNLSQYVILKLLYLFCDVHKETVLYNSNHIIREEGEKNMKEFYMAINILENTDKLKIPVNEVKHHCIDDGYVLRDEPDDMYRTPKRIINIKLSCPPPIIRNIRYSQNYVSDTQHRVRDTIVPTVRRLRFDSDTSDDTQHNYVATTTGIHYYE